jgi:hypothetical protein
MQASTKRVLLIAATAAVVLIGGGITYQYLAGGPTQPRAAAAQGQGAQAPAVSDGSLGRGTPSNEFNQQYAERLRAELERVANEGRKEMRTLLDASNEQTKTLQQQLQRQEADIRQLRDAATATPPPPPPAEPIRIQGGAAGAEAGQILPGSTVTIDTSGASQPVSISAGPASVGSAQAKPVIPPNGFIRGRLLSGIVATVGQPPTNALIRLEGQYRAANGFSMDLDGCTLAVEARADLAAGRIDGKPARLTCNFENGLSKTWDASGWLVDADGIRGVRGIIVSNEGKKIFMRGLASAIDAAGRAIVQEQYTTFVGPNGATSSFTGDVGRAVAGGALSGVGSATADEVINYYKLFAPSIQVGAKTSLAIVLANLIEVPPDGAYITPTFTRDGPLAR